LALAQVAAHGFHWKMIGDVMQRYPLSIRNKYFELGSSSAGSIWTREECETLKEATLRLG
jgi:hypothetical protein